MLLEELRLEAVRQTGRSRAPIDSTNDVTKETRPQPISAPVGDFSGQSENLVTNDRMMDANIDFSVAMPDQMSDYAGWDQFASMLSSGLGNLDAFLNDDTFGQLGDFGYAPQ